MQYSLPPLEPVAQRWRSAALAAAGVAAAELVVIAVVVAALLARGGAHRATAPPPAPLTKSERARLTSAPAGRATLPRGATKVTVLNGNGLTGAAAAMAGRVRRLGYRIAIVGNAPRADYVRTVVMYRGRFRPEAVHLAREMRIRVVGPLDGLSRSALGRAQLAVVVGR